MPDKYFASLEYLYSRLDYERAGMPGLSGELRIGRTRRLLKALGDPQERLAIIHVAGTKGKGSTSLLIAAALSASGIRTGMFSSPHIHSLEERFQVDGVPISRDSLVSLVNLIKPIVARLDAGDSHLKGRPFTFFEIITALALLYFTETRTEAVVFEVGLGGRLDSTNVVRPRIAVITPISYDHMNILGTTIPEIAREKAGILKRGGNAVVGDQVYEAHSSIARVAQARNCQTRWMGTDYQVSYIRPDQPLIKPTPGCVQVETWRSVWGQLELPLLGQHQAHNAATALATLDLWSELGEKPILKSDVIRGWTGLRFAARVEVLSERPWIVIDGAHNVASAHALVRALDENLPRCSRTLVFGTTRDKDLSGQLEILLPYFDRVIITRYLHNPRAIPPEEIAACIAEISKTSVDVTDGPASALELARIKTPPEGMICVTGSLFLAAEARALGLGMESPSQFPRRV